MCAVHRRWGGGGKKITPYQKRRGKNAVNAIHFLNYTGRRSNSSFFVTISFDVIRAKEKSTTYYFTYIGC